jgi:hypothetical protein
MVIRNGKLLLDLKRGFNESSEKARGDVPLEMAVEKPNA